ncbi:multifunctional protein ADE2-like protein [Leptotrombidium deliense]|uniref:Multifunctional protein ADE2-like protein n=1 Tax=Leptotrombidium deliense TaxID=299467 RepID=A0A443SA39_9ACAR|nr:multifunctional protein ADE2-like protein [Leptotrombidium deliense]
MEIDEKQIGEKIIEGKTKRVFHLKNESGLVYVLSKDRITAGDGAKAHEMKGKAKLSTQTNCAVFEFLNAVGIKTHFVSRVAKHCKDSEQAFVAKECAMIPIEWVTRRVATGSYLRRNPHVKEGYRFAPPKLETFFKDDENHDPFWSLETLIEAKLNCGGLVITETHVQEMLKITQLVFEVLERVWQTLNHALIDMKIEFGVVNGNEIVVADVIDNDSWRLWPGGDKRLMLDKQVYRNMDASKIDENAIAEVRSKFEIVAERTQKLFGSMIPQVSTSPQIGIILGSKTDLPHAEKIKSTLTSKYGINDVEIHVCSAHKSTEYALNVISRLMQWPTCQVIIACAGRSNGLGPVAAANTTVPVLNCPPMSDTAALQVDVWSSLRLPSGMGSPTIIGPENAALAAAQIIGNNSPFVWSKIRSQQAYTIVQMMHDDSRLNKA